MNERHCYDPRQDNQIEPRLEGVEPSQVRRDSLPSSLLARALELTLLSALLANSALATETAAPQTQPEHSSAAPRFEVNVEPAKNQVSFLLNGETFTVYRLRGEGHYPYFYPVYGPHGVPMTRNWPMEQVDGEATDHPHHRSLWFAHGDVNGFDFWTGIDGSRIVHDQLLELTGGHQALLRTTNHWLSPEGEVVARDQRRWTFDAGEDWRSIDLEIVLRPARSELILGDTKEGTMALRVAPGLRLTGEVATGHLLNSQAQRDGSVWGQRARWVDYHGTLDDRQMGIAMFDHPQNPRHPTWWHARAYGLFAANPFGIHDFEKKPPGSGQLRLVGDEALTLRYRILFYAGSWSPSRLDDMFRDFAESKPELDDG